METIVYKRTIFVLMMICSSVLMTACDNSKSKGPSSARPAPKVGVINIKSQSLVLTTELAGRTSAFLIAEVRPQVSGIILQRSFEEGGEVTRGQSLYQIDSASYQAKLDVATAELARDAAALTTAKLKARRYKDLLASKDISQEAYDDADAAYKQAIASVAIGKAALETAKIDLAYTKIKAPASGHIGRSSVTQGALVTADQTMPLATILQLDPIYVDLTQSSADLLRLKRALSAGHLKSLDPLTTKVDLILEDGSHYPLPGKIQFSEVSVNESTGTVTLRARLRIGRINVLFSQVQLRSSNSRPLSNRLATVQYPPNLAGRASGTLKTRPLLSTVGPKSAAWHDESLPRQNKRSI